MIDETIIPERYHPLVQMALLTLAQSGGMDALDCAVVQAHTDQIVDDYARFLLREEADSLVC